MNERTATAAAAAAGVGVPLAAAAVVLVGDPGRGVLVLLLLVAAAGGGLAWALSRRVAEYAGALERSRQEFRRALVRLGGALGASDDRQALVEVLLDASLALSGGDTAVFWQVRAGRLHPDATRGVGADLTPLGPGEGLAGTTYADGQPRSWRGGPSPLAPGEGPAVTALSAPVQARQRLYGVLALYRRAGAPFGDDELDDVVGLASQAATAIDATFLHEEARRQSLTDGLTSLWNRRQFELRAAQELERATRFGERFAVVLLDLDAFKAINDTHGHLVGDAVLVEVAQRLETSTREVDTVARFGGEEFVLLLPQTDVVGALQAAEKVRAAVAARPVETDAGALSVTLSAGVACHPGDGPSLEVLLGVADDGLYAAKAAGKNRVVHVAVHEHGAAPA